MPDPEITPSIPATGEPTDNARDLAILAEGEDEKVEAEKEEPEDKEDTEEEESEEEKEEDDDDLSEEELDKLLNPDKKDEKEEEEDEDLKLTSRPSFDSLQKEAPEFFKKHPELRDMYFREAAFSQIFPTVDDAREAVEQLDNLSGVVRAALSGNTEGVLDEMANVSQEGTLKFIDGFLPTLQGRNPQLFIRVATPVIRQVLLAANAFGAQTKNADLVNATQHISNYLWKDPNIPEIEVPNPTIHPERERLEREKQAYLAQRSNDFLTGVQQRIEKSMLKKAAIAVGAKQEGMTDEVYNLLVREVAVRYDRLIKKDPRMMASFRKMKEKAEQNNFNPDYGDKLFAAYLGRAGRVLPAIAKKLLSSQSTKKDTSKPKLGVPAKKVSTERRSGKIDYKNTSDDDIFDGTIKYK